MRGFSSTSTRNRPPPQSQTSSRPTTTTSTSTQQHSSSRYSKTNSNSKRAPASPDSDDGTDKENRTQIRHNNINMAPHSGSPDDESFTQANQSFTQAERLRAARYTKHEDKEKYVKQFFDPEQDPEERRKTRKRMRELGREINGMSTRTSSNLSRYVCINSN